MGLLGGWDLFRDWRGSNVSLRFGGLGVFIFFVVLDEAYQHSIKYLKLSLHRMFASGSSLSLGMGCLTM